jgi:SAM-dependent methyltransferase
MASIFRRAAAVMRGRLGAARERRQLEVPVGSVDFGDLGRVEPISRVFGLDRGTPIDRYYIESFLAQNSSAIRGRVLEIGDATYTKRFGGSAVEVSDVLHFTGESPEATIVADLRDAPEIATDTFDCIVLTQMLQFSYEMERIVAELFRILKPGGCVLATVSGISQISRYDMERWGDYWRLTSLSARELFETAFPAGQIEVETYGNVLAATAFLHGLAVSEVSRTDLDVRDGDYQLIISIRATKPAAG